jgi:AcrR family transcriptional regulator
VARGRAKIVESKEPLSAERIELAALELIEAEGLAAFSTRKLAGVLGCEAMSIYHYFPSKGHLMDALVDRVMGKEMSVLAPGAAPWREQIERSAHEWRRMALKHPSFFGYLALHRLNTPTTLTWLNGMIATFGEMGASDEVAARMFRAMGYYMTGALLDETAGYARGPSTVAPVPDDVMAERYPAVQRAGRWFASKEHAKTFSEGLRVILDGVERELKAKPTARKA